MKQETKKIIIVGDGACGKTCMLEVLRNHKFPDEYVPTVVDNFAKTIEVNDKKIVLTIWDTAGQEDYDSIRKMSYKNTDGVLICYSIDSASCLSNIKEKWMPEVKSLAPEALCYLVGLKKDIREELNDYISEEYENILETIVTKEKGEEVAKELQVTRFFECSSRKNEGIQEIFEKVAEDLLNSSKNMNSKTSRSKFCFCCNFFSE